MRRVTFIIITVIGLFATNALAQGGGKAEPRQISFVGGKASVVGTLRNGQEMDYVFTATKGQVVTIVNATQSQFDFRVWNEEFFSEGDFDSSPSYTFEIPETADYLFTVRKKQTGSRSARFSLRLVIK